MKKVLLPAAIAVAAAFVALQLGAHCEIPCGIYDDPMRIRLINEHIDTIAKSIHEIRHLEEAEKPNYNQLVRWVTNKDDHATQLQHIVSQYFLTQRLAPVEKDHADYDNYIAQLTLLHKMQVEAMKAKQTVDPRTAENLRRYTAEFEKLYFAKTK